MSACPLRAQLDAWRPRVKGLVWRRLRQGGCHVDIDDLVQAGTIGLWHAIERYDGIRDFEPFAVRMIQCHILAEVRGSDYLSPHMRRAARRGEFSTATFVPIDDVAESELRTSRTPCDLLEIAQARKHLHLLPELWQRLITMRYEQDMDWPEICAATGQRRNTAQQMCHRAQAKLRTWMLGRVRPLAKHAGRKTA